jgi:hypothetical protein
VPCALAPAELDFRRAPATHAGLAAAACAALAAEPDTDLSALIGRLLHEQVLIADCRRTAVLDSRR